MVARNEVVGRSAFFDIDVGSASPELAALIAAKDWSRTPLGDPRTWPPALRTILEVALANRFPMVFWWGDDLIQLYNDPYRVILGALHPKSLGQPAQECWREIWDVIGPPINSIYRGGPSTWNEDLLLDLTRKGFVEECYFTFSYSPLPDPSAPGCIGGVLATVQETTQKVIGERHLLLLRDLAAHGTEPQSVDDECRLAAATLEYYAKSVPFALIYLVDESKKVARLAASAGVAGGGADPPAIDLDDARARPWPLAAALRGDESVIVEPLDCVLESVPAGPWPEPPRAAIIVPIKSEVAGDPAGFLVAGVNPRMPFDESYRGFFDLIAAQIASALANARAYQGEKKRAEALAELDRAKITFFSNVSHEFRTPLTLMLGQLEELARTADAQSLPLLETAHRNALRLLKLVNTLLEFSRIEVGRTNAAYVETDLATMTRDLCGLFRGAIENAGLRLSVATDLAVPVYIDRSMWEKIVFNLLSNALKFTLEGEIRVTLEAAGGSAQLRVSDTGIGIPKAELPRLFERFHRVVGAKSPSHEGSGIGLALVDELVRLHGGSISADSELGTGTTFTLTIPLGRDHLDSNRVVLDPQPAVHDSVAAQYLADVDSTITRADGGRPALAPASGQNRKRILFADDNADLRDYVSRILAPLHDVVVVKDGREALAQTRAARFDLIISDIMMPDLDGFDFLAEYRATAADAATPFILLSARAGEESAVEGLARGADDYLTKPFSAQELTARVAAHLNAASIRERATDQLRSNEERFRMLAASMPHIVVESDPDGAVTFLSLVWTAYTGLPPEAGYGIGWSTVIHKDDLADAVERWHTAVAAGEAFRADFRMRRHDGRYRWQSAHILPQSNPAGRIERWSGTITDIDDGRRAVGEREFLSNASRILAQSLDLETTLQNVAQLMIPEFADWCQIDLRAPDGRARTVAIAHRDPAKAAIAQQFVGRIHLNPDARSGASYAIRTGRSDLIEDIPAIIDDAVGDVSEVQLYRDLGVRSSACIPIVVQGKPLGAIGVVYADSNRTYTKDDLPMLEELGRRAGSAIRNASEFEREHRVATSFQEASLPLELPQIEGVEFDAVYVPANDEAQVGGDWYDAVRLFDGRVVVSIGDVTGNGLRAAVTMGTMRQIIRGIAQVHADPALMLDAADRALRLENAERIVTAFVGVLDPIAGTLAYASAGHPPPLLRHPDGRVELLSDGGLPLGLRDIGDKTRGTTAAIASGSHLVFYTDGLTEYRQAPADGEARLIALVADGSVLDRPRPAAALRDALCDEGAAVDDVAILVVGVGRYAVRAADGEQHLQRWSFDAADGKAGQAARRDIARGLRERGAGADSIHAAEVVFGELLGNAARHALGVVDVLVDWSGSAPVLHVLDRGSGFDHIPTLPKNVYSESGRGLYLITLLSEDFHVTKRHAGGSHARAVLSTNRSIRGARALE